MAVNKKIYIGSQVLDKKRAGWQPNDGWVTNEREYIIWLYNEIIMLETSEGTAKENRICRK